MTVRIQQNILTLAPHTHRERDREAETRLVLLMHTHAQRLLQIQIQSERQLQIQIQLQIQLHMWQKDTSVVSKYAASLRLLKCNYAGNMLVAISDYDNEIIHSASSRKGAGRGQGSRSRSEE